MNSIGSSTGIVDGVRAPDMVHRRLDQRGDQRGSQCGSQRGGQRGGQRGTAGPDPSARATELLAAYRRLRGPDQLRRRRALLDEILDEAVLAGAGHQHVLRCLLYQTVDAMREGDPLARRRWAELQSELARDDHVAIRSATRAIEVMLSVRAGRLDEAELLAKECSAQGRRVGRPDAAARYLTHLVAIRWYQGRLTELLPLLSGHVKETEPDTVDCFFRAAWALAAASAGDRSTARGVLATCLPLVELPRTDSWPATMFGAVEAAYLLRDRTAAARLYRLLEPYAHVTMMAGEAIACFGSGHHALGVASIVTGHADRAVAHLHEAVHHNLMLGHWPAVVHSRLRLAEAMALRGGPDDEAAVREQHTLAATTLEALGARRHTTTSAPPADCQVATCRRDGGRWRIQLGTRAVTVDHSVGMLHLAVLLANAGTEHAAVDLVAGVEALRRSVRNTTAPVHLRHRTAAEEAERARPTAGRALRRAIAAITRLDPVVGAHLNSSVHTGNHCWYRPL